MTWTNLRRDRRGTVVSIIVFPADGSKGCAQFGVQAREIDNASVEPTFGAMVQSYRLTVPWVRSAAHVTT